MITLFLLGLKGLNVLKSFNQHQLEQIVAVVIGKDKNIIKDYSDEIESFCKENNLNYFFRGSEVLIDNGFFITIGWRWLIKTNSKVIVIHDSILPKYRGFAPLVAALINGDNFIGATALIASDDYDRGDIIEQISIEITYPIKIQTAIELISNVYIKLIHSIFFKIQNNKLDFKIQDESEASYSLWRNDEDYFINWSWSAEKINRFINAVGFPYLGAKTYFENEVVTISDSEIVEDVNIINRDVGKVIFKDKYSLTIVCGEGLIKVSKIVNPIDGRIIDFTKKFRLKFK